MVSFRQKILTLLFLILCALSNPLAGQPIPYANSHYETIDSILLHYRLWNEDYAPAKGKIDRKSVV